MTSPEFQEATVLIPAYSIEDLPTDLPESSAASLLNAFAVAWHPHILTRISGLPGYQQAESMDLPTARQIVLVPECSKEWLGHDWEQHFDDTRSIVLGRCSARDEWLACLRQKLDVESDLPSEILQPFFSLGICYLQTCWLSRRMHFFVDPDSYLLESEAHAAAEAAVAGRTEDMHAALQRCFECLLDCREQFQPTECWLLDICLPSDQTTADELARLIAQTSPLTLICSGEELEQYAKQSEAFAHEVTAALADQRLSLMCGQYYELRTSLGSVSSLYSDIDKARNTQRQLANNSRLNWARRRFGLTASLPSVLSLFQVGAALHVALDDGIYPDREIGEMKWQGPDGSSVFATSRIPMAIDGASSFLRFADRYAESMQEDRAAVMLLARLPQLTSPWLNDLRVAAEYAPALGRFVTMDEFARETQEDAVPTSYTEGEYLSPFLIQSSVLKTEAPVSSPAELHLARAALESAATLQAMLNILKPGAMNDMRIDALEDQLNAEEARRLSLNDADTSAQQTARLKDLDSELQQHSSRITEQLTDLIPSQPAEVHGLCLLNPLPWKRSSLVRWPADWKPPAASPGISEARRQQDELILQVTVPGCGFSWITEQSASDAPVKAITSYGKPLAEELTLRNHFFEAQLNERTGGIAAVTFHGQRANRMSQQVAFRYEHAQPMSVDGHTTSICYATQRLVSSRILSSGPMTAAIEVTCHIADAISNATLAEFRQVVSVERNSPRMQIQITFDRISHLPAGNPWLTYYACRFAWENEAATLTRSMLGQARGFRMERFEAPDYIEVADTDTRLVISTHGRPYHRRSGHRMLDSLLIAEGEAARSFDFTIEFDQPYPLRCAAESHRPLISVPVSSRRPAMDDTAWLLGVSAKNVAIARLRCLPIDTDTENTKARMIVLLQETEGRAANCVVHTARRPRSAALVRPDATVIRETELTDTGVPLRFEGFQLQLLELTF